MRVGGERRLGLRALLLAAVAAVAEGLPVRTPRTSAVAEPHASVVRRETDADAPQWDHNDTASPTLSMTIDSAAMMQLPEHQESDVFISTEAKARLGLPPDAEVPRRDALLRARMAILEKQRGISAAGQAVASEVPSFLQEAAVTTHGSPTVLAPTPPQEKVPEWRKYAIAEDGTPDISLLVPAPKTREQERPEWASGGLAQEDMATTLDKEMARLGMTSDDKARAAMESEEAEIEEGGHWSLAGYRKEEVAEAGASMEQEAAESATKNPVNEALQVAGGKKSKPVPIRKDPFAFRFYRFTPLKLRDIHTADAVSLSELGLWSFGQKLDLPKVAVAFNELGRCPAGEEAMKARDGDVSSKWTDTHMGSIVLILPWDIVATNFAFGTSPDHPERDPIQWYWEGSKDNKHWTMLLGQLSDSGGVPTARSQSTDMFSWKVDCLVSDWHEWGACSANCSGGNQTRVRSIQRKSWNDGECKANFFQVQHCNEELCNQAIIKNGLQRGVSVSFLPWVLLGLLGGLLRT